MTLAIELTSRAVRWAAVADDRITALGQAVVPPGGDPIQALGTAQIPRDQGRDVVVVLNHDEMLVRIITQPPCPRDRLDKLVWFELTGGGAEGAEAVAADWTVVPGFGDGDFRVLGLAVKRALLARIRQALAVHGLRLSGCTHPGVALYRAWHRRGGTGDALLADVGGASTHLAVVRGDELCLMRTLPVGMDALVDQVAELRGMPRSEAATLVARLRASSPDDVLHLVKRQAGAVGAAIAGAVKFARAQLQIEDYKPTHLVLAGAGAQVHGFADAVAERAGAPPRFLNPFAGLAAGMPAADLDQHAALPSAHAVVLGAAAAARLDLDAIADDRRRRAAFWATDGILRLGVALAAAVLLAAVVWQETALARMAEVHERLGGAQGLVPAAQKQLADVSALEQQRAAAVARLAWLDADRRAGRVTGEMLAAVASVQHPERCPVVLEKYRSERTPEAVRIELEGFAKSAGSMRTSDVLHAFEQGLRDGYPLLAQIESRPQPIERDRQRFLLVLTVPHRTAP